MALVQIQILSNGRVLWAKLSQAAKLVAGGQAEYVPIVPIVNISADTAKLESGLAEASSSITKLATAVVKASPAAAVAPQEKPKKGRR